MERIIVESKIVNGRIVFEKVVEELPLFQRTGDLTETLGQYPCAITSKHKKRKQEEPIKPDKTDTPLYSPDGIMYG